MGVELQLTSDGSHTLFNPSLNETYHSSHGALQESVHVFIKSGLEHVASRQGGLSVLEVGLGTGLNALLSVHAAQIRGLHIDYMALEAFPLDKEITNSLNYPQLLGHPMAADWFLGIHAVPWEVPQNITPDFLLTKVNCKIQDVVLPLRTFDIIYFDAFAPQKQPEMWLPEVLKNVAESLTGGGCLVTYCAKGQVKRDLRAAGLTVESLPGPPGKREMIRATRPRT